jgi:hypothetical protein
MSDLAIAALRYGGTACGIMTIVIAGLCLAQLSRELEACRTRREARNVWVEINWVVGIGAAFLTASLACLIGSF